MHDDVKSIVLGGIPVLFGHLLWPVTVLNRLGALCRFFAFASLFCPQVLIVSWIICNSGFLESSLFALLDKYSGCVLSTDLQASCLCNIYVNCIYIYVNYVCLTTILSAIYTLRWNTFWMTPQCHPPISPHTWLQTLISQNERYCPWHLLCFPCWTAWTSWSH